MEENTESVSNGETPPIPNLVKAQESLQALDQQVRAFVDEHPFAAVAGAVAAGFFFGRFVARL